MRSMLSAPVLRALAACLAALLVTAELAEARVGRSGGSRALRQQEDDLDFQPEVFAPAATPQPAPPPEPPPAPAFPVTISGSLDSLAVMERAGAQGLGRRQTATSATDLGINLAFPEGFTLAALFRAEPVPQTSASQGLPAHAAWVETLVLRWDIGTWTFFGGKIHPRFGVAWQRAPGLYGADLAAEYELREKLGFGVQLDIRELTALNPDFGIHILQFEVFRADTSLLTAGVGHPRWTSPEGRLRWRNGRDLGGADNTPGMGGFALSLTGSDIEIPGAEGSTLGYAFSYTRREPGQDANAAERARREDGRLAFLRGHFELPLNLVLEGMGEIARLDATEGFAGRRTLSTTGAITLRRGALAFSYVQAARSTRELGRPDNIRQRSVNATLDIGAATGIEILGPVSISLDARQTVEGGRRSEAQAAVLLYSASF
ncbi:hypothetical protein [Plastoroseomonas arctica]|uniref:Uncharacterized protein n=1 Tax=Plastoroseomonas arctica TaxID=1509237 RepID=A0AAF1KUB0_9PROT|nr:hypothetical protein [Plastoroseomonas arctica]MBR0655857.1 hypothetical protein [Plastoroseomonas arctica]